MADTPLAARSGERTMRSYVRDQVRYQQDDALHRLKNAVCVEHADNRADTARYHLDRALRLAEALDWLDALPEEIK